MPSVVSGNSRRDGVSVPVGVVVGVAVEAATEVLSVEVSAMEDPPALAAQAGYEVTRAVVRRPDAEPIVVLSLEHLLECVYRSALLAKEGTE